jgi:hypothetical protein
MDYGDHLSLIMNGGSVTRHMGVQCNNCGRFADDPMFSEPCPANSAERWDGNAEQYVSAKRASK